MEQHNLRAIECDILWELHRYSFLTVSHLQTITGKKSKSYLRESLSKLKRLGYIRSFTVVVTEKIRAQVFYYMAQKGADFLIAHKNAFANQIHVAAGAVMATRDYFHRYFYVSLMVALRLYAEKSGIEIDFLHSYFSKNGSNKKKNLVAQTKIPLEGKEYYVPDGILKTEKMLVIIELYNDFSIQRIVNSLATNARAVSLGTPGKAFGFEANPKILAVFTHESTLNSVLDRLRNTNFTAPMSRLFFFATLESLQANIGSAKDIDGIHFQLQ